MKWTESQVHNKNNSIIMMSFSVNNWKTSCNEKVDMTAHLITHFSVEIIFFPLKLSKSIKSWLKRKFNFKMVAINL